jgi:two-component sensor histidine kinase
MPSADDQGHYGRYLWLAVAGWIVLSLLSAPGFYLDIRLTGESAHAETALGSAFVASVGWAAAAFLLLTYSAWMRRRRLHGVGWFMSHLAFGVVLVLLLIVLLRWWTWPVLGLAETLRAPDFTAALASGWPRGLAIYAGVWGLCQAGLLWRRQQRLQRRFLSSELRRLRAQLNPHFLFNTMNAIAELGYEHPETADRTITQLSSLLRKSLDDSHQQEIALRDELDFLRRYLDIQQTLLQGRLQIEFDISDHTLNARVPGMILQPLVENAVTHGVGRSGSGWLKISSARHDDALVIEIADNGWGLVIAEPRGQREGIGIANTRARLRYLYGELAGLELLSRPGEGLTARLNIPFHEAFAFDENPYPDR